MPVDYFSDRTRGRRARREQELTAGVWGGIVSLFERGITNAWFGSHFPLMCEDGKGPYGCDRHAVELAVSAEIPDLELPLRAHEVSDTLPALDLVEFMYRYASKPTKRDYHSYFGHNHLRFDEAAGQQQMRERINQILSRGGMAYELDEDGEVAHLASPAVEEVIRRQLPSTSDSRFDDLLESAVARFRSPDPAERRESLEPLWDAFERMKTILDPDKKRGAEALIARATAKAAPEEADLLDEEMHTLTEIGNRFRIRHHETGAIELSDPLAEQLFARLYALIYRFHPILRKARQP
jgi:hypothetical protein